MRFLAANDLNHSDPMPPLGEKVERAAPPTPSRGLEATETKGVFRGPDGKFFTAIPENEVAGGAPGRAKPLNGNSSWAQHYTISPVLREALDKLWALHAPRP